MKLLPPEEIGVDRIHPHQRIDSDEYHKLTEWVNNASH
jgi:hypothetical protein